MEEDVNHLADPKTKEKLKAILFGGAGEDGANGDKKKPKDYFSEKI